MSSLDMQVSILMDGLYSAAIVFQTVSTQQKKMISANSEKASSAALLSPSLVRAIFHPRPGNFQGCLKNALLHY